MCSFLPGLFSHLLCSLFILLSCLLSLFSLLSHLLCLIYLSSCSIVLFVFSVLLPSLLFLFSQFSCPLCSSCFLSSPALSALPVFSVLLPSLLFLFSQFSCPLCSSCFLSSPALSALPVSLSSSPVSLLQCSLLGPLYPCSSYPQ